MLSTKSTSVPASPLSELTFQGLRLTYLRLPLSLLALCPSCLDTLRLLTSQTSAPKSFVIKVSRPVCAVQVPSRPSRLGPIMSVLS